MKHKIIWFAVALATGLVAACGGGDNNNVVMTPPPPDPSAKFVAEVVTEAGTASSRAPDDISMIAVGSSETASPIDISTVTVGT